MGAARKSVWKRRLSPGPKPGAHHRLHHFPGGRWTLPSVGGVAASVAYREYASLLASGLRRDALSVALESFAATVVRIVSAEP